MSRRSAKVALLISCMLTLGIGSAVTSAADTSSDSSAQVKAAFDGFNSAFNANDAHAAASSFTRDGEYISVPGEVFRGPQQIEAHLAPLFAGRLKGVHRDTSLREIRLLRPDTALLVADYTTKVPANGTAAAAEAKGIYDWILVRQGKVWRITVWHEANFAPPPATTH